MRAAAFAVAVLCAAQAFAQPAESPRLLLLEIWLNGRSTHRIARVELRAGDILLRQSDAEDAGLKLDDADARDGIVNLASLKGVSAGIDGSNQRLLLTAAAARLKTQIFDLRPSDVGGETAQSPTGAVLEYDTSASVADVRHPSVSGLVGGQFGLSVFTPDALFTASGFATAGPGGGNGARLDTALAFDDPAHVRRLVLGDAISGSVEWSRAVRFGGIQFASDFSLRPDLVTMPLPDFFGTAAVPSTVDVFSGAARLFETDIAPGPFELVHLPVVTGGGTVTVDVRDVLGRQSVQTISFYATERLLAAGLTSFDIDAGFLRRDYGLKSFAYATPLAAFTVRHGISADVTFEAHGEATPHVALAGGGFAFGLGDVGAISADLAASRGAPGTGVLASLGVEGWLAPLKVFGSVARASGRFADIAALDGDPAATLRVQLGAAISFNRFGSLAASWAGQHSVREPRTDLVSASYSLAGGNGLFFGLTGLRDIGAHVWAAQAFVSVPLGNGFASSNANYAADQTSAQAVYAVPADPDGGFGWRIMAQDGSEWRLEGETALAGATGNYDGALDLSADGLGARADVSGAVVFLGGRVFAARPGDGAFALVKTGAEGVRIYRENRDVAVSDADGEALLVGLAPYAPNHIAIDPRDYPITTAVAKTEETIVPRRHSGVVVDLRPGAGRAFMARFVLSDGSVPPVGARVDVAALSVPLMVGRNGEVFLAGLTGASDGVIHLGSRRCAFTVAPPPEASSIPQSRAITCVIEAP